MVRLKSSIIPPTSDSGGPPGRKVIVSTNIAKTSSTLDGIVYVVDPGFLKQKVYNPCTRVASLIEMPVSKALAQQRAGRADLGNASACKYTEDSFMKDLKEQTHPEILRCNLVKPRNISLPRSV